MSNCFNPNPTYHQNYHQLGELAAFLLGTGCMPPLTQQEIAVAAVNHMLDNMTPGPANLHADEGDKNMDPQLRAQPNPQANQPLIGRVLTHIPLNAKATRDIEINVDTTLQDFVSRMCANMGLDPNTAELGWKLNDDLKHTPARLLATEDDLQIAFCDLLKLMNNQ